MQVFTRQYLKINLYDKPKIPYNLIFVVMNQVKYNLNTKIPKIAF